MIFHSVSIFNRFILLVIFMLLHLFINFHVCLTLNPYLVSNLLVVSYKCYVGEGFGYYKRFLLARKVLFDPCLMCDFLVVIYEYFAYSYTFYSSVRSEKLHFFIGLFILAKTSLILVYSKYDYT